jgi:hypothetical protein
VIRKNIGFSWVHSPPAIKKNETVVEFNDKFNNLVKSLHQDVKPPAAAILIYYIEAFEGEMRYVLQDKDPQNL